MKFLINLYNHNETGKRSLEDVVAIICHQLRALGHEAGRTERGWLSAADGYNIVVEAWTEETIGALAEAANNGAKFIILATEEPTGRGFNYGLNPTMIERQRVFPMAAKFADAILCLVPGTEHWYSQFAPAAHIELGYAPSLYRPQRIVPDHDFGFYGSSSERRTKIYQMFAKKIGPMKLRVVESLAEGEHRDREMGRCRVILQIRASDKMGLVSSSRCATALHLGRPVVAEPHKLDGHWKDVVHFSKSIDDFVSDAIKVRAFWQSYHDKQLSQFKRLFSPERCIGDALSLLGLTEQTRAIA